MVSNEPDIKMRILLAAKRLFARQGFDGTSVRQICEEAGANVALVSYHFGGKEKVFTALFEHFFPGRHLESHQHRFQDPMEGLGFLIREVVVYGMHDEEMSTIVQQEMMMQTKRYPLVREFTLPVWQKARELLELGREKGVFRYESLDHALLLVMSSALAYKRIGTLGPLLSGEAFDFEVLARDTVQFILQALGAPVASA